MSADKEAKTGPATSKPPAVVVIPTAAAPLGQGKAGGAPSALPGHSRSSSSDSLRSSGSGTVSGEKNQALCRICLEEDSLANLEAPCGCTGTQRYAHKGCIQRWVDEKGHLKCEICDHNYRGDYTVPPPGPALDDLNMFGPTMFIRVDPGGTTRGHDRALDFLDESDNYYQRSPAASWCFTFVIFIFFLVVLHHTMLVADGMDVADEGSPASGGGGGSSSGAGTDDYAAGLTMFLFWIGTKAFLIGIPLYTIMRIAARQARREQYEAMMRSGGLDVATRSALYRIRARQQEMVIGVGGRPAGAGMV